MPRLVYILSASHSGSTLLAMLLGAHPDLAAVGELKVTNIGNPERYRCSCRALIKECTFWNRVNQTMRAKGFADFEITNARTNLHGIRSPYVGRLLAPLYRGPFMEFVRDCALALSPAWKSHLRSVQNRNAALIESLQSVTQAKWIVDSSKIALRLKYLLKVPGLEIKVIRLKRDGRAVALTYTDEWNFADAADPTLRGGGSGDARANAQNNFHDAAREWRRSNEAADAMIQRLPALQWTEVRYEDLCVDPQAALQKLCRFLEIDPAGLNLDFRSREQHVIGNGMRLDSSSEVRLDTRWQTHLPQEDLQTFEGVAGALNRAYGY